MHADAVLEEFRATGLALETLPGNSAKLRLMLDLATLASEAGRLRILDVGCSGPEPLNLWQPFLPVVHRLELVGVDVASIERAEIRARQLGLDIELQCVSADRLIEAFGGASFDAVTTTQVLEHLPDWQGALREMCGVLRPGGTLFVTCDSGDLRAPLGKRVRLIAKRRYAAVSHRVPAVKRAGDRFVSGEWEHGIPKDDLGQALDSLGLEIESLERYCLHCVKVAQRHAGSLTRIHWLAMEEALAREASESVDSSLYGILYARARRTK